MPVHTCTCVYIDTQMCTHTHMHKQYNIWDVNTWFSETRANTRFSEQEVATHSHNVPTKGQ